MSVTIQYLKKKPALAWKDLFIEVSMQPKTVSSMSIGSLGPGAIMVSDLQWSYKAAQKLADGYLASATYDFSEWCIEELPKLKFDVPVYVDNIDLTHDHGMQEVVIKLIIGEMTAYAQSSTARYAKLIAEDKATKS
jgi:hypothetical protein